MPAGRHLRTPRRRRPVAALVAAVVALVAAAPSPAAAGGGAVVSVQGRPDLSLSASDLEAAQDVGSTTYTVRRPGEPDAPTTYSGTSAAAVARLAGVTPQNVGAMTITFAGAGAGQSAALTTDQVATGYFGDPVAQGAARMLVLQPITTTPDSEFRVFRPLDGAGDPSTNEFQPPGQGVLTVAITPLRPLIDVTIEGPTQIDPAQPATFVAHAAGGDEQITAVQWRFGDDGTATGASAAHSFGENGSYAVRAVVTTSDGRSGIGSATVQVGAATPAPGPAPPAAGSGAGGPKGGGGDDDGPANGPSQGDGSGSGKRTSTSSGGSADRSPKRRSSSSSSAPDPAPVTPAPARPASTAPRPAPRKPQPPTDGTSPPGDAVTGVLVAARTAAIPEPSENAAVAGARKGSGARSPSDLAWILGPLAVVVLLSAGAARELRPRRRSLPDSRMPST